MSADDAKQGGSSFLLVAAGLFVILAVGGWLAAPYINAYLEARVDPGDYHADPDRLDKLNDASLKAPQEAALPGAWPQWRGPRRDGSALAQALLDRWPAEGPRLLWKVDGGPGFSSLAAADGFVYTMIQDGKDEAVVCLDANTGKEAWRHRYPGYFTNPESGAGPTSTPVVCAGKVYAIGSLGMFHCLDAATGKVLWKHDLLEVGKVKNQEYGTSFSPLIVDDLVITMPGGQAGKSVAAFDRQDGRLVWQALDDRAGYSSPIVATLAGKRQVVWLSAESALGFAPQDGQLLWKFPWPAFKDCNVATPIVAGNYLFISTGYNKGCALLEIADIDDKLQARPVYEHNRMRNHFSTSVLHDEHLYGFDMSFLVCMDLRSGKILWKQRGFDKGSVVRADGKLIVLGERGKVALVKPSPAGYEPISSFSLETKRFWTPPIVADGKLFIRDEQDIWCFELSK